VLEVTARSGSGRLMNWTHNDRSVATPCLVVPETSLGVPALADIVLTKTPTGDRFELVSDGTWFHPENATHLEDALVIRAPRPGPTGTPQTVFVGDDLAIFHDAGGWSADPRKFVEPFITACEEATMGRALYAPALGKPADYAVFAYLGIDVFDASKLLIAATRGEALTADGTLSQEEAQAVYGDAANDLVAFNLEQARQELARVRAAISQGRLRHLAERRAANQPESVALLRRFDAEWLHLESRSPVNDIKDVPCMTWDSIFMPEVERYRRRMATDYTPPEADILVLLPCSARKPYRLSSSHRYFGRALDDSGARHRVHEVMVTSPMGIVPRDLEDIYPANMYDVPVTGKWNLDEEKIIQDQMKALLAKKSYKHILVHTDEGTYDILKSVLPGHAIHSATTRASGIEACTILRDMLRDIRDAPVPEGEVAPTRDIFAGGKVRKIEDLRGLLSMQFGPQVAAALTENATARGRVPYVKLFGKNGEQLGQTVQDRGMLSLTFAGAEIVAAGGRKRVFQGDFDIKKTGSLFATGIVDADRDVRPGDEVVVMRGETLVGCGVSMMTADELKHLSRGVGVSLRHVKKVKQVEVTA
jgi:archaeosine synthase